MTLLTRLSPLHEVGEARSCSVLEGRSISSVVVSLALDWRDAGSKGGHYATKDPVVEEVVEKHASTIAHTGEGPSGTLDRLLQSICRRQARPWQLSDSTGTAGRTGAR